MNEVLGQISIVDFLSQEDAEAMKKKKSDDWKWSFKDYPKKNGLKVFSCFNR